MSAGHLLRIDANPSIPLRSSALPKNPQPEPSLSNRSLDATLLVFDEEVFEARLRPAFVEAEENAEALLILAEDVIDQIEGTRSTLRQHCQPLFDLCDQLLDCVERAEDQGHEVNSIARSRDGDRYLRLRDRFLVELLRESELLGMLFAGEVNHDEPVAGPKSFTVARPFLQYWSLTVVCPEFPGVRLVPPEDFLATYTRVERQLPLLSLLEGRWEAYPGFRTERLLSLGGAPDAGVETTPLSDWVVCGATSTRRMFDDLRAQLRRFLHFQFLRNSKPSLAEDLIAAYDPADDQAFVADYDALIQASPWSEGFQDAWDYLAGRRFEIPAQPILADSPTDTATLDAEVLGMFRELYGVFRRAAEQNKGLLVMFHQPRASEGH